jgi:hypothetical protein
MILFWLSLVVIGLGFAVFSYSTGNVIGVITNLVAAVYNCTGLYLAVRSSRVRNNNR